jgi:hypothetical protein
MTRLVAMLGEGHSRISPPGLPDPMSDVVELTPIKDARLAFHRAPLRLHAFSDGLYVVAATAEYRALIGARVERIGNLAANDALEAVKPLINRDNDMGARLIGPDLVAVPEVLQAVGAIPEPSRITYVFRKPSGEQLELAVAPLAVNATPAWVTPFDGGPVGRPLAIEHPEQNLWAMFTPGTRTLLVRVNVIQNMPSTTVAAFAQDLDAEIASRGAERLVIDLRDCHGGDNQLFRALLLSLIRNPRINQPSRLFVLTGRGTFSAAVNANSDLERLTNAIFVGEPAAGSPSSWGDPKPIVLINSGLTARISTVYWRDWTADESRPWIAPDIAAAISSADYFAGRDPAMRAVDLIPASPEFGDVLVALARAGAGPPSFLRLYYQHKTDPAWAKDSTEKPMQRLGEQYLQTKSYDAASLAFRINARDYPTSLDGAIAAVRKAEGAAPDDPALRALGDKLAALKAKR